MLLQFYGTIFTALFINYMYLIIIKHIGITFCRRKYFNLYMVAKNYFIFAFLLFSATYLLVVVAIFDGAAFVLANDTADFRISFYCVCVDAKQFPLTRPT